MVLNRLVAFIYTVVGVGRWVDEGRGKEAPTRAAAVRLRGEECCVCLSRMEEGEERRRMLPCMHEFRRECVDRWVSRCRKNCPICRFSMREEERSREAFTEDMLIWFSSFHTAGF